MTGKLGLPPTHLTVEPEDLVLFDGMLWRIHQTRPGRPNWNELRHFGPVPSMRFDPQAPPEAAGKAEGVQYVATAVVDALAEAFQNRRRIVTSDPSMQLVGWEPVRQLTLLNIDGRFGIRNGGAATLAAGSKRFTQAWARAVHDYVPAVDGLWHRSSMTGGQLVTLFTPCEVSPVWPATPTFNRRLDDAALRGLLLWAARVIGYQLS